MKGERLKVRGEGMKKALKILGITLGSVVGIILLVIGLAIWVVVVVSFWSTSGDSS